jgi:hypothetical protein
VVAVATAAVVAVATAAVVAVVIDLPVPVVGKIAAMALATMLLLKAAMPMTKAAFVVVALLVAALVPLVVMISLVTAEPRANRPSLFLTYRPASFS